jgi:hypothetical protein
VRTVDLTGKLLAYWVAQAEEHTLSAEWASGAGDVVLIGTGAGDLEPFAPQLDMRQGDEIIDRERIGVLWRHAGEWMAGYPHWSTNRRATGDTRLVAAMRARVMHAYGDQVPDEL